MDCASLPWAVWGGFFVYKLYKRWWIEAHDRDGFLPPEIMLEILSKLDVKQLLRCKSVCKQWNALIEGHEFTDKFMSRQPKTYIGNYLIRDEKTRSYTMTVATCDGLRLDVNEYRWRYFYLFKAHFTTLSLTNPATRQTLCIPTPKDANKLDAFYALSFVPSLGDYKIVSIYSVDSKDKYMVLTVGDACKWRVLDVPVSQDLRLNSSTETDTHVVHVGTNIHCIKTFKVESDYMYEIRSLDLESECFHVTNIPKDLIAKESYRPMKWEDYLAFVVPDDIDRLNVLVLEDHKKNKWKKKFFVSMTNLIEEQIKENMQLQPLVVQHGLLWCLRSDNAYVGYNIKMQRLEETIIPQSQHQPVEHVFCHVPTVVSLRRMRTY